VTVVGKTLNENKSTEFDEVRLSDSDLFLNHRYFTLPVSLIKSLQLRSKNNEITMDDVSSIAEKKLVKKTFSTDGDE
jgi:hypothetical protein